MRTLGIDLASKPKRTAACVVAWSKEVAVVESIEINVTNARILELHAHCQVTGIDSPFGWPIKFVEFVIAVQRCEHFDIPGNLAELYFRATDHIVWKKYGKVPLAVAADKIAIPAMRCADLLQQLNVCDKSGDGRVFEVYPAVALKVFGVPPSGAKGPGADKAGLAITLASLMSKCPWLRVDDRIAATLIRNDDAFDALVCSLVSRSAACGLTETAQPHDHQRAKIEGWIHVPTPGALSLLPIAPYPPS